MWNVSQSHGWVLHLCHCRKRSCVGKAEDAGFVSSWRGCQAGCTQRGWPAISFEDTFQTAASHGESPPSFFQAKSGMRMGLEQITDTDGSPLDLVKGFVFFGASFVPSFFLAAYFLGGYYPPLALGASTEPSWWPTAMQYANGIPMGTLAENVKKVEAKEKAAAEAKAKVEAAKKAAKKAAKAAKAAAEAAKAQ